MSIIHVVWWCPTADDDLLIKSFTITTFKSQNIVILCRKLSYLDGRNWLESIFDIIES